MWGCYVGAAICRPSEIVCLSCGRLIAAPTMALSLSLSIFYVPSESRRGHTGGTGFPPVNRVDGLPSISKFRRTSRDYKKEDPGYCHWDSHKMRAFYGSPFYWIDFGQVNCPKSTPKALSDPGNPSSMQKRRPRLLPGSSRWRSRRDSNPRYAHHVHTISNRARYGHFDTAPYLLGLFS